MIKKTMFCILLLSFSCVPRDKQLKDNNVEKIDTNIKKNNFQLIDTINNISPDLCIYDSSLYGVQIEDKTSVVEFLNKVNIKANIIGESIIILNHDSTIFFQIHQEPGGLRFETDILSTGYTEYFSIGKNIAINDLDSNYNKIYISNFSNFKNNNENFYLGMSEKIFMKMVDIKCYNKIEKNNFIYYYGATLVTNNFIFKNGILIYFEISYIV